MGRAHLLDLPPEIISHIFSFIPVHDVTVDLDSNYGGLNRLYRFIPQLCLVSKSLLPYARPLLYNNIFIRLASKSKGSYADSDSHSDWSGISGTNREGDILLDSDDDASETVSKKVEDQTRLETLVHLFDTTPHFGAYVQYLFVGVEDLRDDKDSSLLARLGFLLPNLRRFHLSASQTPIMAETMGLLGSFNHITSFSYYGGISTKGNDQFAPLARFLARCHHLKELSLISYYFDDDPRHPIDSLPLPKYQLSHLTLDNYNAFNHLVPSQIGYENWIISSTLNADPPSLVTLSLHNFNHFAILSVIGSSIKRLCFGRRSEYLQNPPAFSYVKSLTHLSVALTSLPHILPHILLPNCPSLEVLLIDKPLPKYPPTYKNDISASLENLVYHIQEKKIGKPLRRLIRYQEKGMFTADENSETWSWVLETRTKLKEFGVEIIFLEYDGAESTIYLDPPTSIFIRDKVSKEPDTVSNAHAAESSMPQLVSTLPPSLEDRNVSQGQLEDDTIDMMSLLDIDDARDDIT